MTLENYETGTLENILFKVGDLVLFFDGLKPYQSDRRVHVVTNVSEFRIQTNHTQSDVTSFRPRMNFRRLGVCPHDWGARTHKVQRAILKRTTQFRCSCGFLWFYYNLSLVDCVLDKLPFLPDIDEGE